MKDKYLESEKDGEKEENNNGESLLGGREKKLVMEKELMQLRFNDAIFSELFLAIQNIYLWSLTPVLRNYMNIAEVQIKKTCP